MKLLEGKVALITGATRGIGKAIAVKYASEGADIAFTYLNSVDKAAVLTNELESYGVKVFSMASDASDYESAHATVDKVVSEFGRIDILVNNAGITKDGLMLRMSEDQWDKIIDANLKSAFNYIHAVTPVMVKQRIGSIINITSIVGLHGNAGQSNYSASKAGMVGLTKSIAQELGGRGVRSNAIAPGFIISDMTATMPEETLKQWESKIPMRRGGKADEVADVALFLASELSSYITGQVIQVDGGMAM